MIIFRVELRALFSMGLLLFLGPLSLGFPRVQFWALSFIFYLDGLAPLSLSPGSKLNVYADDMLLYKCMTSAGEAKDFHYCYLGVTVTSNLSWSLHIRNICTKVRRLLVSCTGSFTIIVGLQSW